MPHHSSIILLCMILSLAAPGRAELKVEVIVDGSKGKPGLLDTPFGIEFDKAGGGWIVELDGGRLHKLDAAGKLTTLGGKKEKGFAGDGGPVSGAVFNGMHNLAVTPQGDVFIADTWSNRVRKIDAATGMLSTIAGTGKKGFAGDGGKAESAAFAGVFCVALNPAADKLFIADLDNKRIRAIDLKTMIVSTVAGNGKAGVPKDGALAKESPLVDPRAVAVDSKGNVYVLERGGHALRVVDGEGRIRTVAGTGKAGKQDGAGAPGAPGASGVVTSSPHAAAPGGAASMNGPKHLCVDRDDNVIIADAENHLIRKYDAKAGTLVTLPITGLARPHGVTARPDGSLYVVDSYNHRVLKVTGY